MTGRCGVDWFKGFCCAVIVACLAVFAMLLLNVPMARGQGVSSSKRQVGENYRLVYTQADVQSAFIMRFPEKVHGVNTVTGWAEDSDSIRTTSRGSGEAIRWVQLCQLDGTARLDWIVYSDVYPSGQDTLWTYARYRCVNVGGFAIDSLACLGNFADSPDIEVWISD